MPSKKPAPSALSLQHKLRFENWGLIDYNEAVTRQMQLVEEVHKELAPQTVVFCTHPPVVTLGRGTRKDDVFGFKGKIVEVSRGGRATYHGPSQVIAYPIVNLVDPLRPQLLPRDLHGYLRALERVVIGTLKEFDIEASGSSLQQGVGDQSPSEATGVWIKDRKIASIGIGVRRWITYHGVAVNLDEDPEAFQGMNPCGFKSSTMISVESILKRKIPRAEFLQALKNQFEELLTPAH